MARRNKVLAVVVLLFILQGCLFMYFEFSQGFGRFFRGLTGFGPGSTSTNSVFSNLKELETFLDERAVRAKEVDCVKVLKGDKEVLQTAYQIERRRLRPPSDNQTLQRVGSCSSLMRHYPFITHPLTPLEQNFSLAYSIIVFTQASQVVNLLRAIYRPQNVYCIHIDQKASPTFRKVFEAVSRCLPNVFVASESIKVRWGFASVLQPEIVCMRDLWNYTNWKYLINLTGQEFPLKTNYELVRIFKALNGANIIGAFIPPKHHGMRRWGKVFPAPHNITLYKGAVHIAVNRRYVDYVLHNEVAQSFLKWCMRTRHPDEHFFNSLDGHSDLKVPGRFLGTPSQREAEGPPMAPLVRYKNWNFMYPCPARLKVRGICILNVLDVPFIYKRKELFANKFYADYSRFALECLAEGLHNRTRDQTLGKQYFNTTLYEEFARHRDTYKE